MITEHPEAGQQFLTDMQSLAASADNLVKHYMELRLVLNYVQNKYPDAYREAVVFTETFCQEFGGPVDVHNSNFPAEAR